MKKMFKAITACFASVVWASAFALTEINLPADRQVHQLDIDVDDNIIIYLNGDSILEGSVKTDYTITITTAREVDKAVSLYLNPTLTLMGKTQDSPLSLVIEDVGNTYFNTPIKLRSELSLFNAEDARVEFNRNLDVFNFFALIPTSGNALSSATPGIHVSGGVSFNGNSWSTELGDGSFFLSGGSSINVSNYFNVAAGNQLVMYGDVTAGSVNVNGFETAQVQLNKVTATGSEFTGGFAFSLVSVRGDVVNFHQDVISTARYFNVQGNRINLYGATLQAGTNIGQLTIWGHQFPERPSEFNSYGGSLVANRVLIESQHNNFGLDIQADSVVYGDQN